MPYCIQYIQQNIHYFFVVSFVMVISRWEVESNFSDFSCIHMCTYVTNQVFASNFLLK